MGAKASSLNCGCKRNKKNKYGRRGSRSGCKSSSHMRYADSFCDPYGGSVVVMQRIGSFRNRRLGSTRTNRQASLNLASLSEEVAPPRQPRTSLAHHKSRALSGERSTAPLTSDDQRCRAAATTFLEKRSKRVGNIEIMECPDMSTISMKSESSHPVLSEGCSENNVIENSGATPAIARQINDAVFESHNLHSDETDLTATLAVPPNSLNSQFISGVTPLDSVREEEEDGNVSSDSVFNYDQNQELFRSYHPAYYNHLPLPPPPTLLVNNNTIPHSSNRQQSGKTSNATRSLVNYPDSSEGPGFDSDFGASAGVETRIVSSDNTATYPVTLVKVKTSALKRWAPRRSKKVKSRSTQKRRLEVDSYEINPTSSSVSRLLAYYKPPENFRSIQSAPAKRSPSAVEASSLHVTMEWDPYDPAFENTHWLEYIIPGVTYPPYPLLSEQQYWL